MPNYYQAKYGKGVTWIKNDSSTWAPVKGLWQKTDSSTWTPVVQANVKLSDNATYESVYPTPRGVLTPSVTSLTFNPYQNHTDPLKDIGPVTRPYNLTVTNTGDYDLIIDNIAVNDSTGNYQSVDVGFGFTAPTTLVPGQSTNFTLRAYGNTVGTGFHGNITFYNDIGYLGTSNLVIPVTVNVLADYNGIKADKFSMTTYVLDSLISTSLPITNTGNGANLNISNIVSQHGYVTISNIPSQIGYNFTTFTGNTASANVTVANLNVGTYNDIITITSDAQNTPILNLPVTVQVLQPKGVQEFSVGGTYQWTVPPHVHRLDITGVGAGGGGGAALANGQIYLNNTGSVLQGGGGGGGGSGASSTSNAVTVIPGETLNIIVGTGGTAGVPANSQFYPVSLSYAWSSFMNSYAVWTNPDGVSPVNLYVSSRRVFTAPYTGSYTILISADNGASVYVDGELVGGSSDYTSTASYTTSMSQGNRILTFVAINTGGPAGFATVIEDSGNNVLWTTRTDLSNWNGQPGETTTITGSFGTLTVAGGSSGGGAYDDGAAPSSDGGGGGGDSNGGGGDGGDG